MQLVSVQALTSHLAAYLCITGAMKNTTIAASEIGLGLPPLDMSIWSETIRPVVV